MIPQQLIDKAETAAIENWGRTGILRAALTAALEAVAADIWEEGRAAGWVDYLADDLDDWAGNNTPTPNPYRASETA